MGLSEPLVQATLLGEAVENGPSAIFVADEEMRYIAVNSAACSALGYTRAELLALRVTDLARYDAATDEYAEVVAHGVRHGRAELTRKDGKPVTFRYRASKTVVAGMPAFVSIGDFGSA